MKRILVFMLAAWILSGCEDPGDIEPGSYNLEKIEALGGPLYEVGKELSLAATLDNMPMRNNWQLVFYVKGVEISRQSLNNSIPEPVLFARFTPTASGEYPYKGCIVSGSVNICLDRTFTVK